MVAGFKQTKIQSVTTLGQQFRIAREKREASIVDAETATSISTKYLIALEGGCYNELPVDVYAAGFVRRYAEWLEMDAKSAVKQYRRERNLAEVSSPKKCANHLSFVRPRRSISPVKLIVTPERFIGLALSLLVLTFVGYLWFQVKSFAAAPPLELATTAESMVVQVDNITLNGTTAANAKLDINGQSVTVNPDGKFTATIHLVDGVNTIELRAQNKSDQETVKVLKVLATLDDNDGSGTAAGVELPLQQ